LRGLGREIAIVTKFAFGRLRATSARHVLRELCVLSKSLAFRREFSKMGAKPPVIRASGGRCDVTRCAPRSVRGATRYP
jgi:hypothetical protein